MRISELKATIEIMRGAYPFKDEETAIVVDNDLRSRSFLVVTLQTTDKATNTTVTLERAAEHQSGPEYLCGEKE